MHLIVKPQKQLETDDTTIQYISGIKKTTLNYYYHGQSSEPTYERETELQKNAK